MRVKDAVVVITGASSGIGRATALAFAEAGAKLVLAARAEESLRAAESECAAKGAQVLTVSVDVADEVDVADLRGQAVKAFGRIDVWVNNAALIAYSPFLAVPMADFRRVIDVNIMGYVYGSRAALEQMRGQGSGILVNVSSVTAFAPMPYAHAYVASKAAIRAFTASLRQELQLDGATGVHACTVMPASIDTPIYAHAANYTGRKVVPIPPVYPPERVARAIVSLVRFPRREVIVGPVGRALLLQSKVAPALLESLMAVEVDRVQLSDAPAPLDDGNLFQPRPATDAVDGGWQGRHHAAVRRAATVGVLVAAGALAGKRLRDHNGAGPARRPRRPRREGLVAAASRGSLLPLAALFAGRPRR
jgi:short-subunit dehydrogenase